MKKLNYRQVKHCLILVPLFMLFSCGSTKQVSTEREVGDERNKTGLNCELSGKAVYTTSYCGGARPTSEIERMHATPRNIKNTSLLFRKSGSDAEMSKFTKTDSLGNFTANLPSGKWEYSIAEDFYANNPEPGSEIPKKCDKFYRVPYGTLHVAADTTGVKLRFRLRCNPCDSSVYMRP